MFCLFPAPTVAGSKTHLKPRFWRYFDADDLRWVWAQAVESSIDLCFRLKQEVGSFALMDDAGFKHMDFLQCCKFAEGDSRILMQKLARDTMKRLKTDVWQGPVEHT